MLDAGIVLGAPVPAGLSRVSPFEVFFSFNSSTIKSRSCYGFFCNDAGPLIDCNQLASIRNLSQLCLRASLYNFNSCEKCSQPLLDRTCWHVSVSDSTVPSKDFALNTFLHRIKSEKTVPEQGFSLIR